VWYWLPWLTLDIPMHDNLPERAAELAHLTDLIRTSLSLADAANPLLNRRSHSRAPLQWGRGFAATEGDLEAASMVTVGYLAWFRSPDPVGTKAYALSLAGLREGSPVS